MSKPLIPYNRAMEWRGSEAKSRLILEVRQTEGERGAGHFIIGALLTIFRHYAYVAGTFEPIEALLKQYKGASIEVLRSRDDEPTGRLQ